MHQWTLKGKKLDLYVILKIIKYCTGSSAKSYQCKFAVSTVFGNKSIESVEEVGSALKKIIHFQTIRGKFSSVHPDLAAEGITNVEVGEEGLHFTTSKEPGKLSQKTEFKNLILIQIFPEEADQGMPSDLPTSDGRVTLFVMIEEELLRRMIEASAHPDLTEEEGSTR